MTLHITPKLIEHAYELLRATQPFKKWKLPPADALGFKVTAQGDRYGHYNDGKPQGHWPHIAISTVHVKDLKTLLEVLAHEMVHIRQGQLGRDVADHGRVFKRLAAQVCKRHGFSMETF